MYRAQPVQNKILQRKWNQQEHDIHKEKIRNVKSSLERSRDRRWSVPNRNPKKEAILETRNTEIERENRILLEKMA